MEDNQVMSGGATEDAQAINVAQDAPGDVITTSGAFSLFPPLRGLELANIRNRDTQDRNRIRDLLRKRPRLAPILITR